MNRFARIFCFLIVAAGIALTGSMVAYDLALGDEIAKQRFEIRADARRQDLIRNLNQVAFVLEANKGFYLASNSVSPEDFEASANNLLRRSGLSKPMRGAIRALGWLPGPASPTELIHLVARDNAFAVSAGDAARQPPLMVLPENPGDREFLLRGEPAGMGIDGDSARRMTLYNPVKRHHGTEEIEGFLFAVIDFQVLLDIQAAIDSRNAGAGARLAGIGLIEDGVERTLSLAASDPKTSGKEAGTATKSRRLGLTVDFAGSRLVMSLADGAEAPTFRVTSKSLTIATLGLTLTGLVLAYFLSLERQNRRHREARLLAEQASEHKARFLANMSHEIRTPINGILGMAKLIGRAELDYSQKHYLKNLITAAESLLAIINDILDLTKLESERLELDPQPTDLPELVRNIAIQFSELARSKGIELVVDFPRDVSREVQVDALRLRQVLTNLISNAIKFTAQGHVLIQVEEVSRDNDPAVATIRFSVSDTGIGIPEKAQALVFERFTQADVSTTKKYGGTGLGLSICRQLVGLMAGELSLHSEEGKGSTFSFTVPLPLAETPKTPLVDPEALRGQSVLILSRGENAASLHHAFTGLGCRCRLAQDGMGAIASLRAAEAENDPYRFTVIDEAPSDLAFDELARLIRIDDGLKHTVLMLASEKQDRELDKAEAVLFDGLLSCPTSPGRLFKSLRPLLQAEPEKQPESPIPGLRILLVEDDPVNQLFADEVLKGLGCKVTMAGNGQEALAQLDVAPFDIVLMDCQMPVMDGYEASRRIAALIESGKLAALPVIALTANAMSGDRELCFEAGMDDYLSKPIREVELKQMLSRWARKSAGSAGEEPAAAAPEDAGSDTVLMDWESLERTRNTMKEKFALLLSKYLSDVESYISEIGARLGSDDIAEIVRCAHTIKSSSRLMGALAVSQCASDLETMAKAARESSTPAAELSQAHADLRACFDKTEALLRQECAEAAST